MCLSTTTQTGSSKEPLIEMQSRFPRISLHVFACLGKVQQHS